MKFKNAAGMITLAAFFFVVPASAHIEQNVTGTFHAICGPADGPATTIHLDNHLRITVYGTIKSDDAYRTQKESFEGEAATMMAEKCDDHMENCKSVEGILTTYAVDADKIEGALEFFDGTETQGDSESIEGHAAYFKAKRNLEAKRALCG